MYRLPFTLPEVGLNEVKGFVSLEDGYLVLRIEQAWLGLMEAESDTFKIEPGVVRDLSVKRGLFNHKLIIKPTSAELLDAVPGNHPMSIDLRIARKYRQEIEQFVDAFWDLADAQR